MRKSWRDCVVSVATTVTQTTLCCQLGPTDRAEGGGFRKSVVSFMGVLCAVCVEAAAAVERDITERSQQNNLLLMSFSPFWQRKCVCIKTLTVPPSKSKKEINFCALFRSFGHQQRYKVLRLSIYSKRSAQICPH